MNKLYFLKLRNEHTVFMENGNQTKEKKKMTESENGKEDGRRRWRKKRKKRDGRRLKKSKEYYKGRMWRKKRRKWIRTPTLSNRCIHRHAGTHART